jgi:ribosomal protein S24E
METSKNKFFDSAQKSKISDIKINTRNELFKRNEIIFKLDTEKTPSFEEMRKIISEEVKKPEENINVYNIKGKFGLKQFNVYAYVYDSKEDLKKAEQKTQKQRKGESDKTKKPTEKTEDTEKTPAKAHLEKKSEEIKNIP